MSIQNSIEQPAPLCKKSADLVKCTFRLCPFTSLIPGMLQTIVFNVDPGASQSPSYDLFFSPFSSLQGISETNRKKVITSCITGVCAETECRTSLAFTQWLKLKSIQMTRSGQSTCLRYVRHSCLFDKAFMSGCFILPMKR